MSAEEEESISKWESLRLKTLAEQTYTSSSSDIKTSLKYTKRAHRLNPTLPNLSNMLTAFNILSVATSSSSPNNNWYYKILDLEPFSHINLIKKSYKKLALILHPDKNKFVASEDAFKLVNEAFSVLSDRVKRKEYDTKLRLEMLEEVEGGVNDDVNEVDRFRTKCASCGVVHWFERGFLGHSLMCSKCKKSFEAVEVEDEGEVSADVNVVEEEEDDDDDMVLNDLKSKMKVKSGGDKNVVDVDDDEEEEDDEVNVVDVDDDDDDDDMVLNDFRSIGKKSGVGDVNVVDDDDEEEEDDDDMVLNDLSSKRKVRNVGGRNVVEVDDDDDMILNDFSSKRKMRSVGDVNVVNVDDDDDDDDDDDEEDIVLKDYSTKRKMSSVANMNLVDEDDEDDIVLNDYTSKRKKRSVRDMNLVDEDDEDDMVLNDYSSKTKTRSVGDMNMNVVDVDDDSDDMVLSGFNSKRKMSSVGDIMKRSEPSRNVLMKRSEPLRNVRRSKRRAVRKRSRVVNVKEDDSDDEEIMPLAEMKDYEDEDEDEEMMTLAEMKKLAVMKDEDEEEEEEEMLTLAEMKNLVKTKLNDGRLKVRLRVTGKNRVNETNEEVMNQDLDIMAVEDSDFYDFDNGRVEKSFRKGQIWALYDDDDGMPRHYGLIEEVVSRRPFAVHMAWLEPQNNGDEELITLAKTGFNISCGRFNVSEKTLVQSLNVFSHIADCERAAREVYRIYPKKGSVWALYSENGLVRDSRSFDIVVFLTSYSEVHGLSMGYLEKVDGFKTIFKRREIGCHAIKWLEKHEVRLFSHQIPARKVSKEEVPNVSGDCWELDPASLSTQLLLK